MKQINKKGQVLENLGIIGISIATFTIIIVVMFLVMSQTKEASIGFLDSVSVNNVTLTVVIDEFTLVSDRCIDERDLVVRDLLNQSTGDASHVSENNATGDQVSGNTVNISNGLGATFTTSINISYTCLVQSIAMNSTEELQEATDDIPGWIPLIVIILIGMLIIGMVARFRT